MNAVLPTMSGSLPMNSTNVAGAGVIRDPTDSSINVGPVNCSEVNNTGPDISPITTVTGTYAVGANDRTIIADATSAAFTVTLPNASANEGRRITIKRKNSGGNAVTVGVSDSSTIDGSSTHALSSQYAWITVESDGTSWYIVG